MNHKREYRAEDGACTNQAESYFARLRRAEYGQHHHLGRYLAAYASEIAWREDNRRRPNGEHYAVIAALALGHPVSSTWAGYWQRRKAA